MRFDFLTEVYSIVFLAVAFLECLRVWAGFTCFGMRSYEAQQISAFAWTAMSLTLVFLLSPQLPGLHAGAFAVPLVWSLAVGDPLLGELRRSGMKPIYAALVGAVAILGVWLACVFLLGTIWWLAVILVPITVAAEWPTLPSIDDNATMLLIPLSFLLVLVVFL